MNTNFKYQGFKIKKGNFFLMVLLCVLFSKSGLAQVYPVQVHTQLIPPYSLKLSDYVTAQSDKFIANVLMTDVNEYNRQLRFRLTIKGNGLNIRSNDFVIGANPVFADGGVPLRLTNIDLRPYFELQNLQGITPQQYNNPLPDGNYSFCLEVFDWVSGQRLSNPQLGCANVYLIVNDPPFLNLPRKGDLVEAKNPQNIVFNWTPRHLNATNVQYEFELRELWDTQIGPQAAFLASPNLYRTTTRNNTLLYGPGETPLLENKTYAWRVRALVSDGISETSVFRNNGYSEIFYFTYTADCKPPQFILAKSLSSDSEEITWQPNLDHQAYKVQYKKKGVRGAVWFDVNAINPQARIYNLEPGTTYEFRVGGQCMLPVANQEPRYTYSAVQEFTTPIKTADSYYNCGIAPEIRISNKTPLPSLAANEVFTAGDFPVTVKQVEGQNGTYSGAGYIVVPYLADTKIAVEFSNIRINSDYQLYAGTLYTTYDPDWGNVDDVSDELDAVAEIPNAIGELADVIADLFKKREEELKNLQQLQDDLTNGTITQEEFDEGAEQIGVNVKAIDEQINGTVADKIINSPVATEEEKKEAKDLELSQDLVSKDTDVDKELANQKAVSERLNEIASAVDERTAEDTNIEIAFEDFETFDDPIPTDQSTITYMSPAGVPVILPKDATPHFLKENNLNVPYGVLSGFTIKNDTVLYKGYHKEGKFTGYKTSKGKAPYQFSKPTSTTVVATIIQRIPYLDCNYFVVKGTYQATSINTTGEGDLITKLSFTGELELVKDEKLALYNECLPDISRLAYDEYLWGYYNFYGRGGFLRFTQAENGELTYLYAVPEGENGSMVGWQYYTESKQWYIFNEPPRGCLSCDLYFLFGAIFSKDAGHIALDAAGMVPGLGEVFDAANGIWYTIDEEYGNAAISFASTIPLVYATTVKNIGYAVKLADGTYQVLKFSSKEAEGLIKTLKDLNLDTDALKLLNKDLTDKAFATAIKNNPELLEAWKLLNNARRTGLRKDIKALTSIAELRKSTAFKALGLNDEILTFIKGSQNLAYIDIINSLQKFGNEVSSKSIKIENFRYVLSDLKRGESFSEGAEWITRYLGDNATDFTGKSIKFEEILKTSENIRRVDVIDLSDVDNFIFYEFKSVKDVPPGHFKEQFIKDLEIAKNLDQIKWLFDGRKAPPNFKENMLKAIDELPLTDQLARKFLPGELNPTPMKLREEIISQLEEIFNLYSN
ncbi:fibronectin type III domain-containing protein [Galbibacter sp. PAP.153]|uniref:fibronectin type III domain-containing protein n=1 Tax=Galbibacter sp. PAP.153 TaxID=3104623 RepID=UPI00300B4C44